MLMVLYIEGRVCGRVKSLQGIASITDVFRREHSVVYSSRVTSAEIMTTNFIVMLNLSFKVADHLTRQLLPSMFLDSAIAVDLVCKRTCTLFISHFTSVSPKAYKVPVWSIKYLAALLIHHAR